MHKDLIKQDINFLEYPIWFAADRQDAPGVYEIVIEHSQGDRPQKYFYRAGYLKPVRTDMLFLYCFLHESQKQGWHDEISLSRFEILKNCGMGTSGPNYTRLAESLERWSNITVKFHGNFFDGKKYQTKFFHVLKASIEEQSKTVRVKFDEEWLGSIKDSDYAKLLSFDRLKRFQTATAMRLYELLIKNFQGRELWCVDAMKLGSKMTLAAKHPSSVLQKIEPALKAINEVSDLKIIMNVKKKRGKAVLEFRKLRSANPQRRNTLLTQDSSAPGISDVSPSVGEAIPEVAKTSLDNSNFNVLASLLPAQQKNKESILDMVRCACKEHGIEYVRCNILYANRHCQSNYKAYLRKALAENWGQEFAEQEAENENYQRQRLEEQQRTEAADLRNKERLHKVMAYIERLNDGEAQGLINQVKQISVFTEKAVNGILELYRLKKARNYLPALALVILENLDHLPEIQAQIDTNHLPVWQEAQVEVDSQYCISPH